MTSPQLGNSWRSTLLRICSQPPCPANLIMANDQFSKEGLKPQLSNSPFEKRGIKGDFSATSAAAIGCIFLNELWFQDTSRITNILTAADGGLGIESAAMVAWNTEGDRMVDRSADVHP